MAEWLKAAVLKTVDLRIRGFESYSLRQLKIQYSTKALDIFRGFLMSYMLYASEGPPDNRINYPLTYFF